MLWPLSVVLVANTNGRLRRLAIPALAGLLVTIGLCLTVNDIYFFLTFIL